MNKFFENDCFWYLWVPLLLVLIPVFGRKFKLNSLKPVCWIKKKLGDSLCNSLITLINISVPIAIGGIQIVSSCNEKDYRDAWIFGFFYLAIEIIVILIERYNNLLPKTKESYFFNKRYAGIQEQWDLISKGKDCEKKKSFIDESLKAIERAIHDYEIHYNQLSDDKIEKFARTAGTLYKDYIRLCSNQNKFYNEIFASLYKYLFYEYKTNVLSSIQLSSNDGADLIIPEFVSNSLTQTIINNANSIEYQHNTSVVEKIEEFENNVKVGTELKGNQNSVLKIKRIIISPELDGKSVSLTKVAPVRRIIDWHKDSYVELKFISQKMADEKMKKYSSVKRLDFSIIKMKNPDSFIILGAGKHSSNAIIAGEKHELYSVKCIPLETEPQSNQLFNDLWKIGLTASINKNNVSFS